MLAGVYSAASGLRMAERQQDVIATNLAHMHVPGYRKSIMTVATFDEGLESGTQTDQSRKHQYDRLVVDFSAGPIASTGRSLDAAIAGDGFFAVQNDGQTLYTRNGSFHVGENGSLVTASGMPVLGESGPLTIPENISDSQIVISKDGTITADDNSIGKLRLVRFQDKTKVQPVGTTLFATAEDNIQPSTDDTIQQGAREQSNVSPIDELVSMIVAMRFHEATQKTLHSINDAVQEQTSPRG